VTQSVEPLLANCSTVAYYSLLSTALLWLESEAENPNFCQASCVEESTSLPKMRQQS